MRVEFKLFSHDDGEEDECVGSADQGWEENSNMFDQSISKRTDFLYGFNKIPKDNLQYGVRYIHTYPILPGMIQKAQPHACTVDFNKCNQYHLRKM